MQRQVKKTGDFGIGLMIHSVHMTDDVTALNAFYEEVFGGVLYLGVDEPNFLPVEDRWAGLIMISDLCIETMAPNLPVDGTKPVGKFFNKYGRHLHSIGYKVDDLAGLGDHLIDEGVYIGRPGGGKVERMAELGEHSYFYPSPRDTDGLMIELCATDMPNDPRLLDTWSSQVKMWELGHPLTITRLAYVTLGVKDVHVATETYVKRLQAVPVWEGIDDDEQCSYQIVQLGDCLVRLAQPLDSGSPLGRHVEQWGNTIFGITLKVADLDAAEAWLAQKNVRTNRLRPTLLAADPADTFGAPYSFTTEDIPGAPFDE
jgi:catechol 2,3-dioxygenase-like lactoylglutathione lyase family enzyme